MFRSGRTLLQKSYSTAYSNDIPPQEETELAQLLRANPKLLESEIESSDNLKVSVISMLLIHGSLRFADFILKKDGYFSSNTDPWYCGESRVRQSTLLHSSAINLYLALATLHVYSKQDRLSDLILLSSLGKVSIKKTHYDCLYWNENGIPQPVIIKEYDPTRGAALEYQQKSAKWFMERAYEVFKIELQLEKNISIAETEEAHAKLADYYLRFAYMEGDSKYAFNYCLEKALQHCRLSSSLNQEQNLAKCEQYVQCCKEMFGFQKAKRKAELEMPQGGYRARTLEEWKQSYDLACKCTYVIGENRVVSCHSSSYDSDKGILSTTTDTLVNGGIQSTETSEAIFGANMMSGIRMTANPMCLLSGTRFESPLRAFSDRFTKYKSH